MTAEYIDEQERTLTDLTSSTLFVTPFKAAMIHDQRKKSKHLYIATKQDLFSSKIILASDWNI